MASTPDLIKTAVERFQAEVPALQKLKLVFGLELKAKHDIQLYRVEVPGPKINKDLAQDERILVQIDRPAVQRAGRERHAEELPQGLRDRPHQGDRRLQREEADRPGRRTPGGTRPAQKGPLSGAPNLRRADSIPRRPNPEEIPER